MTGTTAKDFMKEHRKYIRQQEQKEYENRTTKAAKENFLRKPYMGIYGGESSTGGTTVE